MRFDFDFGWFSASLFLETNLIYFPCDRTPSRDILAFFNGGIRVGSEYEFISDHGLLHFAFLTNQLDEYQARWRLEWFDYHECRGYDSWF